MATVNLGRVKGLSAYEVWLQAGNTGTVDDYLAAITGPAGGDVTTASELPATGDTNVQAVLDAHTSQLAANTSNIKQGGNALQLIETITVPAGGVTSIQRTQFPSDGLLYRLRCVKINLEITASTGAGNIVAILYASDNTVLQNVFVASAINTSKRYTTIDIRQVNGLWRGQASAPVSSLSTPVALSATPTDEVTVNSYEYGNKLLLNTAASIPEGSIIKIWGVQDDA